MRKTRFRFILGVLVISFFVIGCVTTKQFTRLQDKLEKQTTLIKESQVKMREFQDIFIDISAQQKAMTEKSRAHSPN